MSTKTDLALRAGRLAGRLGKPLTSCPYDPQAPEALAFVRGWQETTDEVNQTAAAETITIDGKPRTIWRGQAGRFGRGSGLGDTMHALADVDDDDEADTVDFGDRAFDWSGRHENGDYELTVEDSRPRPERGEDEDDDEDEEEDYAGYARLRVTPAEFNRLGAGLSAVLALHQMQEKPLANDDPLRPYLSSLLVTTPTNVDFSESAWDKQELSWGHIHDGKVNFRATDDDEDDAAFELTVPELRRLHAQVMRQIMEEQDNPYLRRAQTAALEIIDRDGHDIEVNRGAKGRFVKKSAIAQALLGGGGGADSLAGFDRPALMKEAKRRGVAIPRGANVEEVRARIIENERGPAVGSATPVDAQRGALMKLTMPKLKDRAKADGHDFTSKTRKADLVDMILSGPKNPGAPAAGGRSLEDMLDNPQAGDREAMNALLGGMKIKEIEAFAGGQGTTLPRGGDKKMRVSKLVNNLIGYQLDSAAIQRAMESSTPEDRGTAFRPRAAAPSPADLEQAARDRQATIDAARPMAGFLADVEEALGTGASITELRRMADQSLNIRGVKDDPLAAQLAGQIALSVDLGEVQRAVNAATSARGLTRIDAGDGFLPGQHEPIGDIHRGTPVELVRPGHAITINGEQVQISKPVVQATLTGDLHNDLAGAQARYDRAAQQEMLELDPDSPAARRASRERTAAAADIEKFSRELKRDPNGLPAPARVPKATGPTHINTPAKIVGDGQFVAGHYHPDGVMGQAITGLTPQQRSLNVEGDRLDDVLGRAIIAGHSGQPGSTREQLARFREISAQVQDPAAKAAIDRAIDDLDPPLTFDVDGALGGPTPPGVADLMRQLATIPVVRRDNRELEALSAALDKWRRGDVNGRRFVDEVRRGVQGRRHESQEGFFELRQLTQRALGDMETRQRQDRAAFTPPTASVAPEAVAQPTADELSAAIGASVGERLRREAATADISEAAARYRREGDEVSARMADRVAAQNARGLLVPEDIADLLAEIEADRVPPLPPAASGPRTSRMNAGSVSRGDQLLDDGTVYNVVGNRQVRQDGRPFQELTLVNPATGEERTVVLGLNTPVNRVTGRAGGSGTFALGGSVAELLPDLNTGEDFAVSRMPEQLAEYWVHGEGAAKVKWGVRGAFRRARRLLRQEGVPEHMLDGTVANLYRRATGKHPGAHRDGTRPRGQVAAGGPKPGSLSPHVGWVGPLAPIDVRTGDKRRFAPGALTSRMLPLPLRWQKHAAKGHEGAVTVGSITAYDLAEDGRMVNASGYFLDPARIPEVLEAMHLVQHRVVGTSVDLGPDMKVAFSSPTEGLFEPKVCNIDGTCPDDGEILVTEGEIVGATLVPIASFAETRAPALFDRTIQDDVEVMAALSGRQTAAATRHWDDVAIAPLETSWHGEQAARAELASWARAENLPVDEAETDWSLYRLGFLHTADGKGGDEAPHYGLPIASIIDGELKIVPAAVFAAAMRLDSLNISAGEREALRFQLSDLYDQMAEVLGDDTIKAPWDDQDGDGGCGCAEKWAKAAAAASQTASAGQYGAFGDLAPYDASLFRRKLTGPTPLTVTEQGEVFGHAFLWSTCNRGHRGMCLRAPRSATGYKEFHLGAVRTTDGLLPVGKIVMGEGHADINHGMRITRAFYDATSKTAALGRIEEDEWGGAFSGVLAPGVSPEDATMLLASPPSGDWRGRELVAVLAVNVPGHVVPRAEVTGGEPVNMVAAGRWFEPGEEADEADLEAASTAFAATVDDAVLAELEALFQRGTAATIGT